MPPDGRKSKDRNRSTDTIDDGQTDPSKPTVLDQQGYTIIRTLGHGSYANVKLAYSERHKCNVAVKVGRSRSL